MFNGFFAARKNPRVEGHTLYWVYAWNERETEYNFDTSAILKDAVKLAKSMVRNDGWHHAYVLYGNESGAFTHLDAATKVSATTARKNPASSRGAKKFKTSAIVRYTTAVRAMVGDMLGGDDGDWLTVPLSVFSPYVYDVVGRENDLASDFTPIDTSKIEAIANAYIADTGGEFPANDY